MNDRSGYFRQAHKRNHCRWREYDKNAVMIEISVGRLRGSLHDCAIR